MKKILLALLLLPVIVPAQKPVINPRVMISSGAIIGDHMVKPLYQVGAGISYARFFNGLGVGYDQYRFRTIPVFADWRMEVDDDRMMFVYVQPGYHFVTDGSPHEQEYGKIGDKLKGGFYLDAGAGFRIPVGSWNGILISAGYSLKYMTQKKTYLYCSTCGNEPVWDNYHYRYGRILVKAGWELGRR